MGLAETDRRLSNHVLFDRVLSGLPARVLSQRLGDGGALSCDGLPVSAHPFIAALLRQLLPSRPILVITSGLKAQESFFQDLQTWLRLDDSDSSKENPSKTSLKAVACPLHFFPAWEVLPHESKLPHADVISERLETLLALDGRRRNPSPLAAPILVTQATALLQRTFSAEAIRARSRELVRGQVIDPLDLIEWLELQGYEPEAQVNQKGDLSMRGGIVDLYPLTSPWPVRLEFFGNELESLRYFDPVTQMSRDTLERLSLGPAGELGLLKRHDAGAGLVTPVSRPEEAASFLSHLPEDTLVLLSDPEAIDHHILLAADSLPQGDPLLCGWGSVRQEIETRGLQVLNLPPLAEMAEAFVLNEQGGAADHEKGELRLQSLDAYRPIAQAIPEPQVAETQRREFFSQLHRWLRQGYAVHVFCNAEGERQRFEEIWKDFGFDQAAPAFEIGALARGFLDESSKVVVVTDAEVFGRYKVQRPRRLKSPHASATRSALDIDFTDLQEGDYVVHVQHGIGRFLGLKQLDAVPAKGKGRGGGDEATLLGEECLVIEYAPSSDQQSAPRLYVPASEAHLVSKYVGTGRSRPVLNTLGGARWAKTKAQAEEAVRDLAAQLLSMQAARETQPGHAFLADNTWQREFEGAFVYEETVDQLKAIVETKRDMESPRPMDRLICGDVGYGKTEVAIRAAFKAVMGGRQVAILVPTTVLAQQHYNGFRDRMADFPVRVELLSRFRKPKEVRRVIEQLALGGVDIVIGTHRLLQKDIVFKDLGLVVIDEEQRFGVMHKERFKQLRKLVDVLTLSATPIPRTLYLALTGARDMSTIETPPQDRLPVETVVCQFDERVIRDAIQRELNREGQVFYLHNRVIDIEAVAMKLKALVPSARLVIGHGQMDPDDLERVMTQFINGEADVLLSTTIIESGIDIPNANTIIIDRADRFGLSDLYQLRGRVGRYKHQAYAYLLLPRHAGLLTDARKRISAIKQYSSLGSGFKIAMRDLEIRGAGNLLGPEQSGHITAVGFELYCQLLKQSVSVLKGEALTLRVEVPVRFDFLAMNPAEEMSAQPERGRSKYSGKNPLPTVSVPREVGVYWEEETIPDPDADRDKAPETRTPAYVPMAYVSDSRQRIDIYRRLAQSTQSSDLDKLSQELRDRFGPLPDSMRLLLLVQELKILAASKKIEALETRNGKLMLSRRGDYVLLGGLFPRLTRKTAEARLKEIKKMLLGC